MKPNVTLILDEQLDSDDLTVSRALNVLAIRFLAHFRAIRGECPGLDDAQIPEYCKAHGIDGLVTANTQDFAAKRELFRRLLGAGISVVALSAHNSLTPERQVAILAINLRLLAKKVMEASEPILIRLTETTLKEVTLAELAAKPGKRKLP